VAQFLIPLLISLPAAALWCAIVVLVMRLFGFRLAFGLHGLRAVTQTPTLRYIILAGVFMFGGGMTLASTLDDYISWRLWPGQFPPLTLRNVFIRGVVWAAIGSGLVIVLARRYRNRPDSK